MDDVILDPTNFRVTLTDQCWHDHIVPRHPEMREFRPLLIDTVRAPHAIYAGKRDPLRRVYSKRYDEVPGLGHSLHLLVFVGNEGGIVATSYFAALALRMVGTLIWPSK